MSEAAFRWTVVATIALTGLIAYGNSFTNEFVWDDASSVQINKHVQDPKWLGQLFREDQHPFGRGQGNFYRPLVAVSFMVDFLAAHGTPQESGLPKVSPFLFHLMNTLWHIAAAVMLFAVLCRVRSPRFVCAAVPLLYVAHPLHTEAVAYISGRADSMSATFLFAGIWFALYDGTRWGLAVETFFRALLLPPGLASLFRRLPVGTFLSALCFCGGLLCKESATILPVLLLLAMAAIPTRAGDRKRRYYLVRLIPCGVAFAVLAVYAYLRMTVLKFAQVTSAQTGLWHRIIETCQAFALYIKLIFVPTGLHMERTLDGAPGWTALVGAALLVLCVAAMVSGFRRGQWRMALGLAWFLAAWFPISGLIPLNAPMAEHWMYVPLAGFLWALAEMLWAAVEYRPAARKALIGAAWAAGVALMALTAARNPAWRDNETIFRDTLEKNPRSVRVHYNLAVTYEDIVKNRPGARRQYEAVIALYQEQKKAARQPAGQERLWDEEIEAHLSLGRILFEDQQMAASMEHYKAVLAVQPDAGHAAMVAEAALGLGQCFLAGGDLQRGAECFKKALALAPGLRGEVERIVSKAALSGRG